MKKLIIARRISQTFFLLLFIYILWSTTYPLKGLLPPETFFKTNPLIMIFTSISERLILPGLAFAIVMLLLTLVLGRFYCGWVCPLGTMIDGTGAFRKTKFRPVSNEVNRKIRKIKFYILGIIALISLAGMQVAWVLDPVVIMARFVSLNLIPTATLVLDRSFSILIQNFNLYGPVYDAYRALKSSVLGVEVHYFASSPVIFMFFVFVISTVFIMPRFWCRAVCPLGALYALTARFSLLRRVVQKCAHCRVCVSACRMGAILDDRSYVKGECILCMDCVYGCPQNTIKFTWPGAGKLEGENRGISRKDFVFLLFSSVFLMGFRWRKKAGEAGLIRPPAALKEADFLDRCIRCGNCMKVCPTNGLQPTMLQAGIEGIWTPHLVPEIGWCEYNCALCGSVCPTGAITKVTHKQKLVTKLGTAKVDRTKCIAWAYNQECLVCEEHCPVADKAIKIVKEGGDISVGKPVVDPSLCVGCGICQNKCPVTPVRAIRVSPEGADRM
ncbi:MAG: 4Fe-4S binding protein [Candidatus Omnitrophota bacterium]